MRQNKLPKYQASRKHVPGKAPIQYYSDDLVVSDTSPMPPASFNICFILWTQNRKSKFSKDREKIIRTVPGIYMRMKACSLHRKSSKVSRTRQCPIRSLKSEMSPLQRDYLFFHVQHTFPPLC